MMPNVFPQPERPGEMAFSAFDAAYSVAPYALGPDEALVITGRWPECVFANVALWNRFLQTYDYVNRRVGLNRSNTSSRPTAAGAWSSPTTTRASPTGSTPRAGRSGQVYWRYFLPEGDIPTPQATVVPFAEIAAG